MTFTPRQEELNKYLNKHLQTWANEDDLMAIEKIVLQGIDWKTLRQKFFDECTDKALHPHGIPSETYPKIKFTPHDTFEWFKDNIAGEK